MHNHHKMKTMTKIFKTYSAVTLALLVCLLSSCVKDERGSGEANGALLNSWYQENGTLPNIAEPSQVLLTIRSDMMAQIVMRGKNSGRVWLYEFSFFFDNSNQTIIFNDGPFAGTYGVETNAQGLVLKRNGMLHQFARSETVSKQLLMKNEWRTSGNIYNRLKFEDEEKGTIYTVTETGTEVKPFTYLFSEKDGHLIFTDSYNQREEYYTAVMKGHLLLFLVTAEKKEMYEYYPL